VNLGRHPVNLNISVPKIWALHVVPKKQNGDFLENFFKIILLNLSIYRNHIPEYNCIGNIVEQRSAGAQGA
jgi:hypothetical protein